MDWAQIIILLLAILLGLFVLVIAGLVMTLLRLTWQIRALFRSTQATVEAVSQAVVVAGGISKTASSFMALVRRVFPRKAVVKKRRRDE